MLEASQSGRATQVTYAWRHLDDARNELHEAAHSLDDERDGWGDVHERRPDYWTHRLIGHKRKWSQEGALPGTSGSAHQGDLYSHVC